MSYDEGYSTGLQKHKQSNNKVPYGCWFNTAKGSGVYVNIRRSLILPDKTQKYFKEINSNGCLLEDKEYTCGDKYLCTAAISRGYDSIQIIANNELILCYDKCATVPFKQSCPPIELRGGYNASESCSCKDELLMINCGYNNHTKNMYNTIITHNNSSPTVCIARQDRFQSWSTQIFQLKLLVYEHSENIITLGHQSYNLDIKQSKASYKIIVINDFNGSQDYLLTIKKNNDSRLNNFYSVVHTDVIQFKFAPTFKSLSIKSFYLNINDKSIIISVMRYYFNPATELISIIARKIIDASNCIRTAGVSFIILLSGNLHPSKPLATDIQRNISFLTEAFIDISLIINSTHRHLPDSDPDELSILNNNWIDNTIVQIEGRNSSCLITNINKWNLLDQQKMLEIVAVSKNKTVLSIDKEINSIIGL